ncbi:M20 family metallo-hydrolase [Oceanobacillus sp. FSL K6-2867]|uniref:M20 family metallo-hydrolase n=1 Tax=Oceanobacillus sp. FSL K6-2867 TaxID=2954748 RepID=UPI0030D794F4
MTEKFILEKRLLEQYDKSYEGNGISGERIAQRLGELSKIGLTADNGSNRPGFSIAENEAKELIKTWMRDAGLDVSEDGAGNVFGRLAGQMDDSPVIMSGSHVDSVPNGGHFDGPLGVLAALEVAEAWKATDYQPRKPFEVAIFTDEEGSRFNNGLNGSEAMIGKANVEEKIELQDEEGRSFKEVLQDVGLSVQSYADSARQLDEIEFFVEVHIEQGKRLEKEQLPCGIVTGIAGPCWLELTFDGEAGHAGNTPMDDRKDALVAASEFVTKVSQLPRQINDSAVATIGKLHVEPNGVNVIPGKVTLYVDIRDIYKETRDELVNRVLSLSAEIADTYQIKVIHEEKVRVHPVPIGEDIQQLLEKALLEHGISPYKLPSGAGHDAMILGGKLPVAMIFTQSKNGISHNPAEWSSLSDCVQTVQVLKTFVESLQHDRK